MHRRSFTRKTLKFQQSITKLLNIKLNIQTIFHVIFTLKLSMDFPFKITMQEEFLKPLKKLPAFDYYIIIINTNINMISSSLFSFRNFSILFWCFFIYLFIFSSFFFLRLRFLSVAGAKSMERKACATSVPGVFQLDFLEWAKFPAE